MPSRTADASEGMMARQKQTDLAVGDGAPVVSRRPCRPAFLTASFASLPFVILLCCAAQTMRWCFPDAMQKYANSFWCHICSRAPKRPVKTPSFRALSAHTGRSCARVCKCQIWRQVCCLCVCVCFFRVAMWTCNRVGGHRFSFSFSLFKFIFYSTFQPIAVRPERKKRCLWVKKSTLGVGGGCAVRFLGFWKGSTNKSHAHAHVALGLGALDLGRAGIVPLMISMPLANAGCDTRKHIMFVSASRTPTGNTLEKSMRIAKGERKTRPR